VAARTPTAITASSKYGNCHLHTSSVSDEPQNDARSALDCLEATPKNQQNKKTGFCWLQLCVVRSHKTSYNVSAYSHRIQSLVLLCYDSDSEGLSGFD